ncbi:MAG: GNAT family N-acetyltransferase [DPANN group archaeon]|nr:GNAT family N-acetyltransferase [DPANN group archaeon]
MKIRKATIKDFEELYSLGKNTPELIVSGTEEFMPADQFKGFITDKNCVFLVAEEKKNIAGFILAHNEWVYMPVKDKYACIVYLVVSPKFRKLGAATKLYSECVKKLKENGATHVYCWANATGKEIIAFLEKQGFAQGHEYIWMDRKL